MFGFVQMMFTEEYYVCCVWFGFLGEEGVGLNGVLCAFELLAFIIVLYLFFYLGGASEGMKCG